MTSGQGNDWEETQKQIANPAPIINGKTWLRHRVDSQAGLIDQMLLEGAYSVEDIARELNRRFTPRSLAARMQRVRNHIGHLQGGNAAGVKPHKLRLKEVKGKWRFDV
jgi:hypothetical protein